jgi:uncharacterized membrane protein
MIEIIPNWHPIFVHFTIGLLVVATLFHVVATIYSRSASYYQFENVANWNLWVGAAFAIVTALAGWFAFNSVDHDTPSHLAMLEHRNWALTTTTVFVVLAIWSFRRAQKAVPISWLITIPLIIASGLLGVTGYEGGELVYRHGLGVMSLPDTGKHDHGAHDHGAADSSGAGQNAVGSSDQHDGTQAHEHDGERAHEAEHEVGEHDHMDGESSSEKSSQDTSAATKDGSAQAGDTKTSDSDGHAHDHGDHEH